MIMMICCLYVQNFTGFFLHILMSTSGDSVMNDGL